MRTRRHRDDSSLELLLDTVCNAFGGIIFVALLLALLAKSTRTDVQGSPSAAELAARHARLQAASELEHRLEQLRIVERLQAAQVSDIGRVEQLGLQVAQTELALENETQRHDGQAQDARARQRVMQDLKAQLAALQAANNDSRNRLVELGREVEGRKREMARHAKAPRERQTGKSEAGLAVRYGKLYLDSDEFATAKFQGREGIVPRREAGLPLLPAAKLSQQLQPKLAETPATTHYLAIAVWEDSFDQFENLRQAVVEMGYEYRLIPLGQQEVLFTGDVERPLVQ